MAHDYTPRYFLRQAPNGLLKAYFARKNELTETQWAMLGDSAKDKDIIYRAWQSLPPDRIRQVESEFRAIHELANEDGARIIIEEASIFAPDAIPPLREIEGLLHKAFWLFLHEPKLFAHVSRCDHADGLSLRSWKTRKGLPAREPDLSDEAVAKLAAEIGKYYWDHQGRGGHCRGESFTRGDDRGYVFIYPQDYADTFIGYDKDGTFVRVPQQPAFEIVFAFDASAGVLDLYAKGDKRLRGKLEGMFARNILREEIGPEPADNDAYRLDGLKDRNFPMPTDPQDNIRLARVKTLRLYLPDYKGQIVLDTPATVESPEALYSNMDEFLIARQIARESVRVGGATIQMVLRPNGDGREKKMEFNVSARGSHNTSRDRPEDQLARKYLKKWGIASA